VKMGNTFALAEEGTATVYEEPEQPEQGKELADAESLEQEQKEIGEGVEEDGSEESSEEGSELTAGKKEEEEKEEEERPKVTVDDVKTAPMDYRFPTTNQAKHCYTRYNEYHKCVADKGEDAPECGKYARYYRSLCPGEWIDKWNEQRENGTFAGRY
jgi:cytochrome c oxidase subunit 6b